MVNEEKNILLAFVSLINNNLRETTYLDLQGKPYKGMQTNEAAIIDAQRSLGEKGLDKVYMICSKKVLDDPIQDTTVCENETTIEFLTRRLLQEDERFQNRLESIPYDDSSDEMEENLRAINRIAGRIMEYSRQHPNADINIYADMTGGFRYANMMMLDILQILQYDGLHLKKVLYTDFHKKKVFDVTALQNMTHLINGADEFVKFGSVTALQEYFSNTNVSPEIKELLQAMKAFSDAIHICRTGTIQNALQHLTEALQKFRAYRGNDLKEEMFLNIIDVIEREYGNLIKGKATKLDIIRWCLRKEFLQQAMTLCTEWLPIEYIDRKIAYTDDTDIIEDCKKQARAYGNSWQMFFISKYKPSIRKEDDMSIEVDNLENSLSAVLHGEMSIDESPCSKYPIMAQFAEQFQKAAIPFEKMQQGPLRIRDYSDFKENYPLIAKALEKAFNKNQENPKFKKSYIEFIQTTNLEKTTRMLFNEDKLFCEFFNLPVGESEKAPNILKKWENTKEKYLKQYDNGILKTKYCKNDMIECLHNYFLLRTERNQINHANQSDVVTVDEVKTLMQKAINQIDRLGQVQ